MGSMTIQENISLQAHSTMRLGGNARYLVEVTSRTEVEEAVSWATEQQIRFIMIGDGSNIVWRDEGFDGLVIVNKIKRYEVFAEDELNHYVTIGSGENWDEVVARTVQAGLSGIEALSLIPGTTGATPVQNVGAYGQEIKDTLAIVEVFDTKTKSFSNLPSSDCGFGYRTSRFKTTDRGRFLITGLTLHLYKQNPQPPFYRALAEYLEKQNIHEYTPQVIRDAVIAIRSSKLPDPTTVANNGSFFANPIVDELSIEELRFANPEMPAWPAGEGYVKIPAAWLIEQAGFKDYKDLETGMATWPLQPLVLINENAKSTADLLSFKQKIVGAVQTKFGITLEQEPELLP